MNERQKLLFLIYIFCFIFFSIASLSFKLKGEDKNFHVTYMDEFMDHQKQEDKFKESKLGDQAFQIMVRDQVMEDQVLSLMEDYHRQVMLNKSSMPNQDISWGKFSVSYQGKK